MNIKLRNNKRTIYMKIKIIKVKNFKTKLIVKIINNKNLKNKICII